MFILKNIKRFFEMHGFNPLVMIKSFIKIPKFIKDYNQYKGFDDQDFPIDWKNMIPVLNDYNDQAGTLKGHYVHQDLWAAKKIYEANPKRHIDVGSRIDGFITSLLSHRAVEVVDIRKLTSPYENLIFVQDDATLMKGFQDAELESVSCLHAMEHFGLGRYSDPIQPDSYKIFASNLARVIKVGGMLYISMPVGKQRVEFNAHRVFNPQTILDIFPDFDLKSFSAVNDDGNFVKSAIPEDYQNSQFSCGLFEFQKK